MYDLALKDFSGHKMRTILTLLGIVIAISAIVSLGSVSEGLRVVAKQQLSFAGDLIIVLEGGFEDQRIGGPPIDLKIDIDLLDDFLAIDGVEKAEPIMFRQVTPQFMVVSMEKNKIELFNLGINKATKGRFTD